jgi:hypothetical protein
MSANLALPAEQIRSLAHAAAEVVASYYDTLTSRPVLGPVTSQEIRAAPPGPALLSRNPVLATLEKPAGGPAADQGVRPTICPTVCAGFRDPLPFVV